jgi:hypothetical protein
VDEFGSERLDELFSALGELLEAEGETVGIVVVGGASLNMLGLVERTTSDVDVIAITRSSGEGEEDLVRPDPVPEALENAIERVARDFNLSPGWMNTEIGAQWDLSLPPNLKEDLTWRAYGGLRVGFAGRRTLLALKLFAAADRAPGSVHAQDLVALNPTTEELNEAAEWVRLQDSSPGFREILDQVLQYVHERTQQDR